MSKIYFGFAIADSMFPDRTGGSKIVIDPEKAKQLLAEPGVICVANKFHKATIDAMRARFGINLEVPPVPPKVILEPGDVIVVMSHDLPRLEESRHYTAEEIDKANFSFSEWACFSTVS